MPELLQPYGCVSLRLGKIIGTADIKPESLVVISDGDFTCADNFHNEVWHLKALVRSYQSGDFFG